MEHTYEYLKLAKNHPRWLSVSNHVGSCFLEHIWNIILHYQRKYSQAYWMLMYPLLPPLSHPPPKIMLNLELIMVNTFGTHTPTSLKHIPYWCPYLRAHLTTHYSKLNEKGTQIRPPYFSTLSPHVNLPTPSRPS